MFSDNGMKEEFSKRKAEKLTNMQKINHTLLNNPWVKEEINKKIKKYLETYENENTTKQNIWDVAKATPGDICNNTCLY